MTIEILIEELQRKIKEGAHPHEQVYIAFERQYSSIKNVSSEHLETSYLGKVISSERCILISGD